MLMPDTVPGCLFAPCGMNCLVCYVHLKEKKPCSGCLGDDDNKPDRCRTCTIKKCAHGKGFSHCYECGEFPCKGVRNLEKSYNTRYQASLIANSNIVKTCGLEHFQKADSEKWKCGSCGGVISLHDRVCSECKEKQEGYYQLLKNRNKAR